MLILINSVMKLFPVLCQKRKKVNQVLHVITNKASVLITYEDHTDVFNQVSIRYVRTYEMPGVGQIYRLILRFRYQC